MKNQPIVFILSILILLLITDAVTSADDYFNHITVFSDGKITRFAQTPIRVHIAPMPMGVEGGETYLESFRYAMREWEAADARIQFQEVVAIDDADIRVRWQRSGLTQITDTALGDQFRGRDGFSFARKRFGGAAFARKDANRLSP